MNPVIYRKTFEFSEGVPPIVLEAVRLQHGIRVEAGIYLPASVDGGLLWPLDYWDIKIGGQSLQKVWGYPCRHSGKRYRGLWRIFSAPTWEAAEKAARDWLYITPLPLLDALERYRIRLGLE